MSRHVSARQASACFAHYSLNRLGDGAFIKSSFAAAGNLVKRAHKTRVAEDFTRARPAPVDRHFDAVDGAAQ